MGRAPELRALGVGEILDVSIKVYLKHFLTFVKIAAFVVIPVGILNLLVVISTLPEGTIAVDGQLRFPSDAGIGEFLAGSVITAILGAIAGLLATGATFKALAEAYLSHPPSAGESLRYAARRLHSLLWLTILFSLVVAIGTLLLIIPGIYLGVSLAVVIPALMLENLKGGKALRRSYGLVRGRWWPTFGVVILGWFLIPAIVGGIIGFAFQVALVATVDSPTAVVGLSTLGQVLSSVFTTALQAAVIVVLYFDLRVRKEGFDLQLLAERIGGQAPSPMIPGEGGGRGPSS